MCMRYLVVVLVLVFLTLSACSPLPDIDSPERESIESPEVERVPGTVSGRIRAEAFLAMDCNANGVMDLFEVQHKRFSFLPAVAYDIGHGSPAIAVGDFDGDGDTDVAVLNAEANSISILVNDGNGALLLDSEATVYLDAVPVRIAAAQINADGHADLVVLFQVNDVAVFLNAGGDRPNFTLSATYTVADYALMGESWMNESFAVVDLDADGRADIAVLIEKGPYRQLVLLWNDGGGDFDDEPQRVRALRPQGVNSLVAIDVDRNGYSDLVIGSEIGGIALILNSGGRVLAYDYYRDDLHYDVSGSELSTGDLDDDGYPDLLIRHALDNRISILVNTSATGIVGFERNDVSSLALASSPLAFAIGDMDGDGLADIAVSGGGNVSVYLNLGGLSFERAYGFPLSMNAGQLIATELNSRDPLDLLVTAGAGDHGIAALINDSRVSRDCNLNQRPDACDISSGRSNDCNRNGVPDECDISHRVDVSSRIFAAPRAEGVFFYDPRLLLLDLNRDTDPDLLVINNWTADYTRFFLNRSDGTFQLFRNPAEGVNLRERNELHLALIDQGIDFHAQNIVAAVPADFTGDGKIDLAVASLTENSIKIIRRRVNSRGEEYWSPDAAAVYVSDTPLHHIEAYDLDSDGDVDLVAAPSGGVGNIILLRNGGGGNFLYDASWDIAVIEAPSSVAVSDLDRDGLPELVMSQYAAGTITVCKNLSTAERLQFGRCTAFSAGAAPIAVKVGDLDGDGYPDIVVANDFSDHVSVLKNSPRTGIYRFDQWERRLAAPVIVRVQNAPRAYPKDIAIADLDADGDLDIATANWGTDRVSILRNAGDGTFLSPLVFSAGFRPESIRIGDLNSDSRPDITVANGNGDVTVLLNRSRPAYSLDTDADGRPDECAL
jgi:hypothetical protein